MPACLAADRSSPLSVKSFSSSDFLPISFLGIISDSNPANHAINFLYVVLQRLKLSKDRIQFPVKYSLDLLQVRLR